MDKAISPAKRRTTSDLLSHHLSIDFGLSNPRAKIMIPPIRTKTPSVSTTPTNLHCEALNRSMMLNKILRIPNM